MKYVLIVVGCIVVVIALVAICGLLLPEKHVASRKARFRQASEALWAAITGYKGDASLEYKVEQSYPPRRYVTRVIDPQHNFGGTWTWEIQPSGDGSVLRITENGEIYNPIFRFVSRYIMGNTRPINDVLKAVGTKFNENVQIED